MKRTPMDRKPMQGPTSLPKGPRFSEPTMSRSAYLAASGSGGLTKKATAGSTRRTGDDSEARILDKMRAAGLDFKETKNSGATNMDGDMKGHDFMIECKYKSNESHTVRANEWKALIGKAKRDRLTPAMITENSEGDYVAHIPLDVFLNLIPNEGD